MCVSNKHKIDNIAISTVQYKDQGLVRVLDISFYFRSKNDHLVVFPALARLW